jgi:hemoglobin
MMDRLSMFDAAGGQLAFLRFATAFHARCLADPELSHPFSHPGNPEHVERLADYWAEVFGGPARFSESFGGHSAMLAIHAGQGAGSDLGERFVVCFMRAADDAELPDDADFRAQFRAYIEWAVDDVMAYAPEGSEVPDALPVPHWGWEGLQRAG